LDSLAYDLFKVAAAADASLADATQSRVTLQVLSLSSSHVLPEQEQHFPLQRAVSGFDRQEVSAGGVDEVTYSFFYIFPSHSFATKRDQSWAQNME
jgi:hypothetical protein